MSVTYQGWLAPHVPEIVQRIEAGETPANIANDLELRLYRSQGRVVLPDLVMYAYERVRRPWIWERDYHPKTVITVPPREELHKLISSGRSPGTWERASEARIVDLPEDAPLRERWLP